MVVAILLVAIAVAAGGAYWKHRSAGQAGHEGMPGMEMPGDAQSTSATPGMAGMQMSGAQSAPSDAGGEGANTIFIAPQRQQLIGINTAPVTARRLVKEIRAVGKVAYNETKLTHIHIKFTGYIEEVFVDFVGKVVKKGEPLFTIYSPDLLATQEEYLLSMKSRGALKDSQFPWIANGSADLLEAAKRRLRLWDISDGEIEELERTGKAKRALTIFSPVGGIVTQRAAYHHGRYVNPEMDLYTIADISTVWVQAEIYQYELPFVKVGQTAEIEFPYSGNAKNLRGKVVYVYPFLDPKTRTTQVRMDFPNPDLELRPEMFVNVQLKIDLGERLAVPEDAVLDTGTQQYVFVDQGEGYFEPRAVKLGPDAAGYYAIREGLKANERVVTAANFILDSESRVRGVFANMGKPSAQAQPTSAVPAETLKLDIMEPKTAKVGVNTVRIALKDASGKPVENAEADLTLSMPQMGAMPPMSSQAKLKHMGNGQYEGKVSIDMAWTWEATVTVKKDGKVMNARTSITAR
ncbi:MAG: efflux RND transporter periplasmic adaptor subunit [Terriglobales bacterium]